LHRTELCKRHLVYAPPEARNKRAFDGRILGLTPSTSGGRKWGKVEKEHRTANVCGDDTGHDFVVLSF
jgi:hypothetical protein